MNDTVLNNMIASIHKAESDIKKIKESCKYDKTKAAIKKFITDNIEDDDGRHIYVFTKDGIEYEVLVYTSVVKGKMNPKKVERELHYIFSGDYEKVNKVLNVVHDPDKTIKGMKAIVATEIKPEFEECDDGTDFFD